MRSFFLLLGWWAGRGATTALLRTSNLVIENGVAALGGIGIGVRAPTAAKAILQIYQQRFTNPPSQIDCQIVDRLADMIVAGSVCFLPFTIYFLWFGGVVFTAQ